MSNYNDALIRALLGFVATWGIASAFFNHNITMMKTRHQKQIDELRATIARHQSHIDALEITIRNSQGKK